MLNGILKFHPHSAAPLRAQASRRAASVKYFDLIPTVYAMIPTVCANGVSEGK